MVPTAENFMAAGTPWGLASLMAAQTNVSATGGTTDRFVQDRFADRINIRDFGAISDGNSHPLSATFATLAAAQAVFPVATSLSDETDWCAIQMAVNANLPAIRVVGSALINKPIVSGSVSSVTVVGEGQYVTSITQIGSGQDGWQHTSAQPFEMFGLNLQCTGTGGAALNINLAGSAARFTLRDVRIAGNGSGSINYWHDGVKLVGCSRTTIEHCLIVGITGVLSNVGNGIYLAPQNTPSNAGSFIIRISDCIINNWNSGIVLDSTGRSTATDIQGAVFDWINCNGCIQGWTIHGPALEVVLHKCQYEGFGAAVYSDTNGQTVVVRDCLFFFDQANANSAGASLPQDCIYINGGGTWAIKDTRFVLQASATVSYIINATGNAGGVNIRDNFVVIGSGATATGYLNIDSGTHGITESGTVFSSWNGAWPFVTNANAGGGTLNNPALSTLATVTAPTVDIWQNQGSSIGWNYPAASGATAFMNSKGGGAGGFHFWQATSDAVTAPVDIAQLTSTTLTLGPGTTGYSALVNGAAATGRNLIYQTNGSNRWGIFTDSSAESGGNAGSNLLIGSYPDAGTPVTTVMSFVRSSGLAILNGGTLAMGSAAGPTLTFGSAAPAATQPKGSIYLRTGGGVGTTLYVSQGGGTWNPVAGV